LILVITRTWTYPRRYTAALVLGNLLIAVLVRNELFGRFLYLLANKSFAKVHGALDITWTFLTFRQSSGLPCGFVSVVHLPSNTLAAYILVARYLVSRGLSSA
jgi:hypothetical protein